jgi:hypothetical protein
MEIELPDDFREFLSLLGSNGVEYLLIGGYASHTVSLSGTRSIDERRERSDCINRLL